MNLIRFFTKRTPALSVKAKLEKVVLAPTGNPTTQEFAQKVTDANYLIKRINRDGSIEVFVEKSFLKKLYSKLVLIRLELSRG